MTSDNINKKILSNNTNIFQLFFIRHGETHHATIDYVYRRVCVIRCMP